MRRINTLSELRAERKRLYLLKAFLEQEIKKDFKEVKQSLEPMRLFAKGAEKVLVGENNHILSSSAGNVANFLAKATLKRSGFLSRLVVPYLVKSAASNFVEHNKSNILSWAGVLFSKLTEKKPVKEEKNH